MLGFILKSITLGYLKAWKERVNKLLNENIMGVECFRRLSEKHNRIETIIHMLEKEA